MGFRGQGASEYLMTYGWSILAVMIAGIVLTEMGVIDFGSSTSTTSSDFSVFKPLLPTCKAGYDVWNGDRGVSCQFINGAGTNIIIRDIVFSLDGQYCGMNLAATNPIPSHLMWFSAGFATK